MASVSAIYGLGSPEAYKKRSIPIDVETGFERNELIKRLISLRYERNDIAFERGKFRVKGISLIYIHLIKIQDTVLNFLEMIWKAFQRLIRLLDRKLEI